MQSTEEVFPGIFPGDVVVSLAERGGHRFKEDIMVVLSHSKRNCLYYMSSHRSGDVNTSDAHTFRKATPEETEWYKSTYKENQGRHLNLKDMPKVNNTYQIY